MRQVNILFECESSFLLPCVCFEEVYLVWVMLAFSVVFVDSEIDLSTGHYTQSLASHAKVSMEMRKVKLIAKLAIF